MENMIKEKWDEIINHLKIEYSITDVSYRTWILPLEFCKVDGEEAIISIDDAKIGNSISLISKRYEIPLQVAIEEITGYHLKLKFVLKSKVQSEESTSINNKKTSNSNIKNYPFLNSGHTFDTFVVSNNNSLAHAACLAVAESPAQIYNPLFIYGGAGLGKTHLMHSIARYIIENHKDLQVMYITSEEFTNEVIEAIRTNKNRGDSMATINLKKKYRNVDVLLVDDIQFIIGKESTQEEFFHTFNTLYESGKQIIISSDKPPRDMQTLEERLRSRFAWGLPVDIQPPDYETRMAILKKREEQEKIDLDEEIIQYIANNIKSNIRDLEGAFNRIILYSRLKTHKKIDIALAQEALKDMISPDDKVNITVEYITQIVAEHFNISSDHIISTKKSKDISFPRQICMYLCRELTDVSLKDIGGKLGNRDHTTILHGINKITQDMKSDSSLKNTIEVLIKKINPE